MKPLFAIGILIGLFVVYYNIVATLCVVRTDSLERVQKILQLFVIWLIPFIGALFVIHIITDVDSEAFPNNFVPQKIDWCFTWAYCRDETLHGRETERLETHDNISSSGESVGGGE